MDNIILPPELEAALNDFYTSSVADAAFAARLERDLLQRAASTPTRRSSFMQTLRARPLLALVIVILALLLLSGVAYAVGSALGYVPGLGLVDRGAPIRVLAEPVSQTRDGITITVESALLASDKAVVTIRFENVPAAPHSPENGVPACPGFNQLLRLPDGASLRITGGEGNAQEARLVYPAVPAGVDHATFVMPCIADVLPGALPEDWELPLRFVPAPADMTIVPVVEFPTPAQAPSATPDATTPPEVTPAPEHQGVAISQALRIGDKLVFVGGLLPEGPPGTQMLLNEDMKITDANGNEIEYEQPSSDLGILAYPDQNAQTWTAEITATGLAYPLTFTFIGSTASQPDPQAMATFEFDAGHDLTPGQEWQVNKDLLIAGYHVRLAGISMEAHGQSGTGYTFRFECDPEVYNLDVAIPDQAPARFGGGGGGDPGSFTIGLGYEQPLTGKVQLVLSKLWAVTKRWTWQIQWSPEQ